MIAPSSLPQEIEVIAKSENDEIMAIKHKNYPLFGVQFHPELISIEEGMKIIKNFIDIVKPEKASIPSLIEKISSRENLNGIEAKSIASEIIGGTISPTLASSILVGLKVKGESSEEIYGFASSMIEYAIKIKVEDGIVLDNCGTGGDGKNTFNISAISSIDAEPSKMEKAINSIGIGFLFAPIYHPAMKNVAPIRKELGVRTIFNILGPLTNPARPKYQLIGVFSEKLLKLLPEVLIKLGVEKSFYNT